MGRLRWWRLAGLAALLALLVTPAMPGATGSSVLAHAQLVASSPGAGTVAPDAPAEIRLVFSEPLESQATSLDLAAQDGSLILSRAGDIDPDDDHALVVSAPALADGVYSVTWRTLSAADGHTAQGFFTFGVGEVSRGLPQVPDGSMTHAATDPIGVLGRWLTYLGLLLALGMALFHRLVIRDRQMPAALVRLLATGLAVSALATLGVAIASGIEAGAVPEYLFASRTGLLHVARAAVAAVGAIALVVGPRRWSGLVASGTGLAGIVLLVVAGHAAALSGPVPLISQVVHVAAAGVWIGGLAGLLLLVAAPALVVSGTPPPIRAAVPRFSALALVSIGLVGLTGAYAAWMQTGSLLPLDTEFGRTLLIKSALAIGAFGLGGLNYLDGGRMRNWVAPFRARLSVEVVAAVAVLVMSAVLATTPPLDESSGVAIEPLPDAFGAVVPEMSMRILPGRPGLNRVVVTTSGALADAEGIDLALDRMDDGSTTRVHLVLRGTEGMTDMAGMDHGSVALRNPDGSIDWTAGAVVLPTGSRWDTNVIVLPSDEVDASRQRFAFDMGATGIDTGRVTSLLNPASLIAALLLLGGSLGLGLGLGGLSLPRCDASASRVALIGAGAIAVSLGLLTGANVLLG